MPSLLANNHILDYEKQGLLDTLQTLDAAGISHAGAGTTAKEAAAPALLDVSSAFPCRVALLSYTDSEPGFCAGANHLGTNYFEISLVEATQARITADIAQARKAPT